MDNLKTLFHETLPTQKGGPKTKKENKFDKWCERHPIFEAIASFIVICAMIAIFTVIAIIMMS